jgi:hypothetical protein
MSEHGQAGRLADEEPISGQPDSPTASAPSPLSPVSDNENGDGAVSEGGETRGQDLQVADQDTERTRSPSRDIVSGNADAEQVVVAADLPVASRNGSPATSSGVHEHEASIDRQSSGSRDPEGGFQHHPASDGETRNASPEPSQSHSHVSTPRPEPPPQSTPDPQRRQWCTPLSFRPVSLGLLFIASLGVNAFLIFLLYKSKKQTGIAPVSSISSLTRRLVPTACKVVRAYPSKASKWFTC